MSAVFFFVVAVLIARHRYTFNLKGLKYKTIWVEYPDIQRDVYEKYQLPPSDFKPVPNGGGDTFDYYSLPVIHDPSTGKTIADSFHIALYLDETYPSTPRVIHDETYGLYNAFSDHIFVALIPYLSTLMMPRMARMLNEYSQEWFIRARSGDVGAPLMELQPKTPEALEVAWKHSEEAWGKGAKWYKPGAMFLSGSDRPGLADFMIVSCFHNVRLGWGEDSKEWKNALQWQGGKWKALSEYFAQYEQML